jgi:ABC-3C biological conflict system middle component
MIISKDINPKRDLYFLGAQILEFITEPNEKEYDFLELYKRVKLSNNISINLFSLSLTWLFTIGAINHSDKGNIIRCF